MSARRWHDDDRVQDVLDEGELLHVAVATGRGPRITPTAFSVERRQLWFVVARGSVKARAIARSPHVGGLVRAGDQALVVSGRAQLVDPLTARGVASVDRLLDLPFAATGYLGRNVRHAAGIIRGRPVPTLPVSRVAVVVDVSRAALLDRGAVVARWGTWPRGEPSFDDEPLAAYPPDVTALPDEVRALVGRDEDVALGWQAAAGPIALPARWRGSVAETSPAVMALAGAASSSPACVTFDRSGRRLSQKRGVLLSGEGHAYLSGETAAVAFDWERISWWVGDEADTVKVERRR